MPDADNRQKLNDALDQVELERPLSKDPFPRAKEAGALRDQVAEHEAKQKAVAEQREEHNRRTAGLE